MTEFKFRIRDLRRESKMSGEQLAKTLGIGKSAISMWENGLNIPTAKTLKTLADMFNVSVDYLLGKSDVKNSNTNLNITDFEYALYGEVKDLSDDAKNKMLDYAKLLKISEEVNKK